MLNILKELNADYAILMTALILKGTSQEYYPTYYKPFDEAASYGIQEWIGH